MGLDKLLIQLRNITAQVFVSMCKSTSIHRCLWDNKKSL